MNPPFGPGLPSYGDPYDVFLAVCFGCCYAFALEPLIRMARLKSRGKAELKTNIFCYTRGLLTVLGLACLYGWYAFYLRRIYDGRIPAPRMLLDWVSLGLFAVGANWWNNRKPDQKLYCVVQALAIVAFGLTCYLGLAQHGPLDNKSAPMLKACFWCMTLSSSFVFGLIIIPLTQLCFDENGETNKYKVSLFVPAVLLTLAVIVFVDWFVMGKLFRWILTKSNVKEVIGASEYNWTIGVFYFLHAIYGVAAFFSKAATKKKLIIAAITLLPLIALVWVTVANREILFPPLSDLKVNQNP